MKTGVALSGGGIRCMVHIGVLRALTEWNIKIDMMSGTSAGSVVAALYCAGHHPEKIFDIVSSLRMYKSVRPAWAWSGLLKMDGFSEVLLKYLPDNSFETLERPLIVAATDIRNGKIAYLTSGDLVKSLVASCSIPAIFHPVTIDDQLYVDGGIIDNLPALPLRESCDLLVGVHSNHIGTQVNPANFKAVIERSMLLAIQSNTKKSRELCDLYIEPTCMDRYGVFDIQCAAEIYEYGYQFMKENFTPESFLNLKPKQYV